MLRPLAGTGKAFVYQSTNWWSQLKPAGSTIYANRHCLQLYRKIHPERLNGIGIQDRHSKQVPKIIGDVFVHQSAFIHHTAVVKNSLRILFMPNFCDIEIIDDKQSSIKEKKKLKCSLQGRTVLWLS